MKRSQRMVTSALSGSPAVAKLAMDERSYFFREVGDGREVVLLDVLLEHEAVHGGRRAKGAQVEVLHHLQELGGDELPHVVAEDGGAADPLAVDLAPAEFCPAGVRDGHMQAVLLHLLPVLGGDDVAQRVLVAVHDRLGVAGGAAREVHEHDVVELGRGVARRVHPLPGALLEHLVEGKPPLALAGHHDLVADRGAVGQRELGLLADVVVVHADDGRDLGRVGAVGDVFFGQLDGGGHDGGADLAHGGGQHPVFPAAAQDGQDHVALLDAQRDEAIGDAVGQARDVREGELAVVAVVVHPDQGFLVRLHAGPLVHDVVAKVEVVRHVDPEILSEVLVGVEVDAGTVFLEYVVQSKTSVGSDCDAPARTTPR